MYNPQMQFQSTRSAHTATTAATGMAIGASTSTSSGAGAYTNQVAGLASIFRTAHQQLDRDPALSSSATRDLVSRAHQSLPLLCNLVFGLTPLAGVDNQVLRDLLMPGGPLIQVLVLLANDRTTYVYDMNPSMLPEPSLAKLRSGQLAELPEVYAGRVTSFNVSSSAAAAAQGGGTIGLRFNMLEFFLFHFAHAPLRMAQLQQQSSQTQTRHGQQQQGSTAGRRLSGVWESASNVFAAAGAGAASGQRRQPAYQQAASRHPLGSHAGLISLDEKSPPTLYTTLLQSYLHFFVPTNPSSPSPTIFTPSSSCSSSTSSSSLSSWSPLPQTRRPTVRSPTRQPSVSGTGGTWWASDRLECSKFFVGCLVECWLGQELYGPARQEQIKILGKDMLNALFVVVDHISVEALLEVLKAGVPAQVLGLSRWAEAETGEVGLGRIALRAAYHHLSPPLYRFLYSALSHHPLTDSDHGCAALLQVLSIWTRWITPLPATSPTHSDTDLDLVDAFVVTNFAFYTTLVHIYLSRALDLFPLARPQANTRKPHAGYAEYMQGIVHVLMVYTAPGVDKQPEPTVYHASVAQLEHVMLGLGGGAGAASGTRATLESHVAWLEGAPASSAGVSSVRSRWRPVLLDVASAAAPAVAAVEPAAAAGGVVRLVLTESILGWHTRKAILKPYKDASVAAGDDDPRTRTAAAAPTSPRSASFAFMLDLPVVAAGVRAFASTSHVLRPVGVPDAAIAREQKILGLIVSVAGAVAGVSPEEIKEMNTRAAAEVHEFVMQGMTASTGGAGSASPTALGRGSTQTQLNVNGAPVSPATVGGWGLPGPLASVMQYLFGSSAHTPRAASSAAPSTSLAAPSRKVDALDLTPDMLELSDKGRAQLMSGARLCPPVPSMRGHALPRDLYTTLEVPMLVDLAYAFEDAAAAVLGKLYGWSVRGQRDVHENLARGLAGNEWVMARAQQAGYTASGFVACNAHALVESVGFRNMADRALLAWILVLRWAWVLLRLRAQCHYASYFVYPILTWFIVQYPFALQHTETESLKVNLACASLVIIMTVGSDYGWNPAHFLVALCAVGAVGVVGWAVVRKWVKAIASDEMAFLGAGSRESSPAHVNMSGPGPQQQQQQQQPMRQVPRTPKQGGRARGGSRPVSPLAGMRIGQYGSVRS